jgi:hypothetical protein
MADVASWKLEKNNTAVLLSSARCRSKCLDKLARLATWSEPPLMQPYRLMICGGAVSRLDVSEA